MNGIKFKINEQQIFKQEFNFAETKNKPLEKYVLT